MAEKHKMIKERYNVMAMIGELRSETDREKRQKLRQLLAVNIGDRDVLARLLGVSSTDLADFYPDMVQANLSTDETINAFLEHFGGGKKEGPTEVTTEKPDKEGTTEIPEEPETPERPETQAAPEIPVAPAVDYAAAFLEEDPAEETGEPAEMNEEDLRINSFLKNVPPPTPRRKGARKEEETPALTESFAKILIKNGNYSKALEIISELSLKKPEKSIYFADQIRFLRKLVRNQQLLGKSGEC